MKGLTAKAKPWLEPDSEGEVGQLLSGMLSHSDPSEFLGALAEPAGFHLVGIEDTDAGEAAHYRIAIDAATFTGDEEVNRDDTIEMDMWVDKQDRPVLVVTVSDLGQERLRSTLIYADYG